MGTAGRDRARAKETGTEGPHGPEGPERAGRDESEFWLDDPELVGAFQQQVETEATRLEAALETRAWDIVAEIVHRLRSSTAYLGLDALSRTAAEALEAFEEGKEAADLAVALLAGIRQYLDTLES